MRVDLNIDEREMITDLITKRIRELKASTNGLIRSSRMEVYRDMIRLNTIKSKL